MEKIKLKKETNTLPIEKNYLVIGDFRTDLDMMMGLLDELEDTDGVFSAVTIHTEELRKKLEELEVINTNVRGSSFPAKNFKEFKQKVTDLYWS